MDSPSIPDPNKAAAAGAIADVANFPFKAQIDALAQLGGKATINGQTYDFTGLGNADQNAAVSDQMAQALLDIQKNYGAAYVKQRLADLQQADPAGYAARKQMFDRILADAQANPTRPLATDLQNQVQSLLAQGSRLTTGPGSETEAVQQGVRGQQVGSGIYLGNAPAAQEAAAVVQAGDQQQAQRQAQGLSFLQSGVSPEDVQYRRIQQSLANLGNAINGQSPVAEFASLSGAQSGAAPFNPGPTQSPALNPNAALQGLQNSAALYSGQVNWANSQVNPWTAGLATAANATSALGNLGWKPFANNYSAPLGTFTTPTAAYSPAVAAAQPGTGSFSWTTRN
ncbi:MAG TPA: hypothetical protein VF607_08870 [Verrucomicrobiae bacterium]